MSNLESKTLKQILDESGITYSWAGDSQLILSQKYIAEVFAQKEINTLVAKVLEGVKLIDEWKKLNDDYHAELTEFEDRFSITLKNLSPNDTIDEIQLCFGRDDVDSLWSFFSELRAKLRRKEVSKAKP